MRQTPRPEDEERKRPVENAMTEIDQKSVNRAIQHALNYHSIDAKLDMPDYEIADLITPEVVKHLAGQTDVQIIERMTPEERAAIGTAG